MQVPIPVMGRYRAARCGHGSGRASLAEQKEHLASPNIESAKPVVPSYDLELKDLLIELDRALEVADVQGSFQNTVQDRHEWFTSSERLDYDAAHLYSRGHEV
jgi:hypothetical protein